MAVAAGYASGTVQGAPDIDELARALNNDVDEIYKFVYENIEFLPTYASQKGALGCLIDGMGNAFDMSELMVELLRAAGYTTSYMFGELEITEQEAADWFGTIDNNIWAARNLLNEGFIPNETFWQWPAWKLRLSHVWVKVDIGGTDYQFDPAKKTYSLVTGIDLGTSMGFNETTFMTNAKSGATITSDYVKDINRSNIRADLDTYAANLLSDLKTNHHDKNLDEVLGGKTIVPVSSTLRQTSLPYLRPGTTPTEWTTDIPTSYYATLRVVYDSPNIDETFYSKDIHGLRLTLSFNGSNEAELRLDGTLVATSSAQGVGTWNSVLMEVKHAYAVTWADQSQWNTVWAGHPYLLAHSWGNAGKQMADIHAEKLRKANFDGLSATDEAVIGEGMALTWYKWDSQNNQALNVINKLTECRTMMHHQIGVWGHFDTLFENLWGIYWKTAALDNDWDNVNTNDTTFAMHGISFESGVLEQQAGIGGVSSTSLIDIANSNGDKIYDGATSNWLSNVKPNLTGYSSQELTDIENWWINPGWRVAIPEDGDLTQESWQGLGYYAISPWQGAIGIIGGGLKGGSGASVQAQIEYWIAQEKRNLETREVMHQYQKNRWGGDPVDMATGSFAYQESDISVGSSEFPYSLDFTRIYDSSQNISEGPLGLGWQHLLGSKYDLRSAALLPRSDFSPLGFVAGLVEFYVTVSLFGDLTKPMDKWVTVAIANKWLNDQYTDNVVSLSGVIDSPVFVKQPNGEFETIDDSPCEFTLNVDKSAQYTSKYGEVINFDTNENVSSRVFPYGVTVSYTYTSGKLSSVSNGLGRTLSLTYDGDYIDTVSDGNGRTISYNVDGTKNLISCTNAENETVQYSYTAPGLLTQIKKPENPLTAVITNEYDALGRIKKQTDGSNEVWDFYLAGNRSELVGPTNTSQIKYFNNRQMPIVETNPLGDSIDRIYDIRDRLISQTMPDGNYDLITYDKNNNALSVTAKPKSGSGLNDIVKSYTYDPTWNKVASYTSPLGNVTTYNYNSTTGLLDSIEKPTINSQTPTITFTYTSRGQINTFTDETGIVKKYTYDGTNENVLTLVIDNGTGRLNLTRSYDYDAVGNLTSVTDFDGNEWTSDFDDNRNLVELVQPSPFGKVFEYKYDSNRNLIENIAASGDVLEQSISMTYTINDQPSTVVNPAGKAITFAHDGLRRRIEIEDQDANTFETIYDALNRVSQAKENSNTVLTSTYTTNGATDSLQDAKSNETAYEYDGFDRLFKRIYEDNTFDQYSYNADGYLTQYVTRAGDTVTYSYDSLSRLTSKAVQGQPTISYEYDLSGRMTKVSTPVIPGDPSTGDITFTYDTAGRFISEEYPDGKTVSYELSDNGQTTKTTYPDGYYVERVYNELGLLTDIKLNGSTSSAVSFVYDALSRRTSMTYDNGVVTSYTYNDNGRYNTITHSFNGSSVTFTYTYDDSGKMLSQQVSDSQYMWHPSSSGTESYGSANSLNQYPSVAGSTFTYDTNGCDHHPKNKTNLFATPSKF